MPIDVLDAARRRLEALRIEMRQIEAFIEMGEQISSGRIGPIASSALDVAVRRPRTFGSPKPRDIVQAVHAILSDGGTLDKHDLVERLGQQGIVMTGASRASS